MDNSCAWRDKLNEGGMSEMEVLLMCVYGCVGPKLILDKIFNFRAQVKSTRRVIFLGLRNHED